MIRRLAFQQLHITEPSIEERKHAREECNIIIGLYQTIIKIFGILHLFVAGAALGYIVVLVSDNDFSIWFSIFAKVSLPSDLFFYVITFLIFVANFTFVGILYRVPFPHTIEKAFLIISAVLLLISLFLTTFTLPMSYMIKKSINDYGDWYSSKLVDNGASNLFYNIYKNIAIVRMILVIISGIIFPMFVSRSVWRVFNELYHSVPY